MRLVARILGLLALVMMVQGPVNAHAQARGPSHAQTRQEGQHITSPSELREEQMRQAAELAEQERIALQDPAERARRFTELDAILRRLAGRFRVEGNIQQGRVGTGPRGNIRGVADCSRVGDSASLNCIINATWPIIEPIPPGPPRIEPPPPSEQLGMMRPAVLVIGLQIDPPGLRAMMVTADTVAYNWVGYLDGQGVNLTRPGRCWANVRCYRNFRIAAEPDGSVTSFVLHAGAYTITLAMHADAAALPPGTGKPKAR